MYSTRLCTSICAQQYNRGLLSYYIRKEEKRKNNYSIYVRLMLPAAIITARKKSARQYNGNSFCREAAAAHQAGKIPVCSGLACDRQPAIKYYRTKIVLNTRETLSLPTHGTGRDQHRFCTAKN